MKNKLHPVVWSIPEKVKGNCYVFGLGPNKGDGGYSANRVLKARPGDKCARRDCCFRGIPFDFDNCDELARRVVCDNPNSVRKLRKNVSLSKTLAPGNHMMCSMLSSTGQQDFHFARRFALSDLSAKELLAYKQSAPEPAASELRALLEKSQRSSTPCYIWLHQRGWMSCGPVIHDAKNRLITDIRRSDFNYGDLNYETICSFFAVRTRRATVSTK